MNPLGIIIIGRNEGDRLRAALDSVFAAVPSGTPVAYVDSGSSDGSVALARSKGCVVVELDLSTPFTAARARNEGAAAVRALLSSAGAYFFMDGDCRLVGDFLPRATELLRSTPDAAVACGRRREVEPRKNIYHRLADMEWNTSPGIVTECGGDALIRAAAFDAVGGFNPAVIAGEEPELCVRLRTRGFTIHRLDTDMTLHDVAMSRFGQWWNRSVRAGYAFANGAAMHGGGTQRHWLRPALRVWAWVLVIPLVSLLLLPLTNGFSFLFLLAYAKPLAGAFRTRRRRGDPPSDCMLYSAACLLAKFAEFQGHLRFLHSRLTSKPQTIIEYKSAPNAITTPAK